MPQAPGPVACSCVSLEQPWAPLNQPFPSRRVYDLPKTNKPSVGRKAQTCMGLCAWGLAGVGRCHKALGFGRWGCFLPEQTRLLLSGWKPLTGAEKTQCCRIVCRLGHHELVAQGQVHCSRDNFFIL